MQRFAIRLAIALAALLIISQFVLPPIAENRLEGNVTQHGGTATAELSAIPALELLFKHGDKLKLTASNLSVDLNQNQKDVFNQLDNFGQVDITITDSRAGPFTVSHFHVTKTGQHAYDLALAGNGTAGDVARYAGSRLGGAFGQALAGLAASALGGFDKPIPFDATMQVDTSGETPTARNVNGQIAGLPAAPLAQVVANALLSGI